MSSAPKGLRAEILTGRFTSANGGISERVQQVTVVGEGVDGQPIAEIFEATPEAPAVKIVVRRILGETVVHVEPVDHPSDKVIGPMASGAVVSSPDSRLRKAFGFYGAVSLHDRFETESQYAALSR